MRDGPEAGMDGQRQINLCQYSFLCVKMNHSILLFSKLKDEKVKEAKRSKTRGLKLAPL